MTDANVPMVRTRWPVGLRVALAVGAIVAVAAAISSAVDLMKDDDANRLTVVGVAILLGVVGVVFLFWAMDQLVDILPGHFREGFRPYVFVGPALVLLSVFLIYPVINTILLSFKDARGQPSSCSACSSSTP